MIILVKKVTTITEFEDTLICMIEGVLSNGAIVGNKHSIDIVKGTDEIECLMKKEIIKNNCEEDFQVNLEGRLRRFNKT